ncbi:MAG: DNA polymerase III subunit gamma/tau [Pseudobdellovibrionaceae bacterium]|jgi:DNA polymerase-3 subunit gamma/tau|nr:DNA polymerase III subunit gamma/tau [Pseudobdellovibrionaceae bacterium]
MSENQENQAYRVLARKYRPQNFDQLIGQDALVRTLTNAIQSGRVAHAFMLTGVRGVGKTTTARIIAKALNYVGPDGTSGPTTGPTDDCEICRAISEDRHPDIMEMDAASRTGVNDIREILDGVRYAPTSARYKVYIIDEVHMLSTSAFNALLKTLEEPPPHVKFIFATTEIRKVPVTVLSRCQRFDLRRVDAATLLRHYKNVCAKENVQAEDEAVAMIARAADGSVRDGLSILDQAMALSEGAITVDQVRSMLGLADRARLLDLMEAVLVGQGDVAMTVMADLYRAGADPQTVLQDLLDITHLMSKFLTIKAPPSTVEPNMADTERNRAADMAAKTGVPALTRVWQILLKGLNEIQHSPNPQATAEMVIIRLIYAADLPDPATVLKQLKDGTIVSGGGGVRASAAGGSGGATASVTSISSGGGAKIAAQPVAASQPVAVANSNLETLSDVVGLLEQNGAMVLASNVVYGVELVKLEAGRLEYHPTPDADPKLAQELGKKLTQLTGQRWLVSVSMKQGQPTLARQHEMAVEAERQTAIADPVVARILSVFPGAEVLSIEKEDV